MCAVTAPCTSKTNTRPSFSDLCIACSSSLDVIFHLHNTQNLRAAMMTDLPPPDSRASSDCVSSDDVPSPERADDVPDSEPIAGTTPLLTARTWPERQRSSHRGLRAATKTMGRPRRRLPPLHFCTTWPWLLHPIRSFVTRLYGLRPSRALRYLSPLPTLLHLLSCRALRQSRKQHCSCCTPRGHLAEAASCLLLWSLAGSCWHHMQLCFVWPSEFCDLSLFIVDTWRPETSLKVKIAANDACTAA